MGRQVGSERVCGVSLTHEIFCCSGTRCGKGSNAGNLWRTVPGRLKDIAVSDNDDLWGLNKHGRIYFSSGSNGAWQRVNGHLKNIAVSGSTVWGVTPNDRIFYRDGYHGRWHRIAGRLKQIAVSGESVWGVTASDRIYHRKGRTGRWRQIPGHLKQIAVSMNRVWGVTRRGLIYYRYGKEGSWQSINGHMNHIAVSGEHVWGVQHSGAVYFRHGTGGKWTKADRHHTLNHISVSAGASEPSKHNGGCWYRQNGGCSNHPGMMGARGLWHRDQTAWAHHSSHACTVVRKKQINGWCKSGSTMRYIPPPAAAAKKMKAKTTLAAQLKKLRTQDMKLRAQSQMMARRSRRGFRRSKRRQLPKVHYKPKKPCPLPIPRWELQAKHAKHDAALSTQVVADVEDVETSVGSNSRSYQPSEEQVSVRQIEQLAKHEAQQTANAHEIPWQQVRHEVNHQVSRDLQA